VFLAIIIQADGIVVHEVNVNYDKEFPSYETTGGNLSSAWRWPQLNYASGVHRKPGNVVTSPCLMWIDGVQLALERLKEKGADFSKISAVSGGAQQHGTG